MTHEQMREAVQRSYLMEPVRADRHWVYPIRVTPPPPRVSARRAWDMPAVPGTVDDTGFSEGIC